MEQLSYALGMVIGQNLKDMGIAQFDNEKFTTAVCHILSDAKPEMTMAEAHQQVAAYLQAKEAEKGKAAREAGEHYLAENAKKEGVVVLPSGLQYQVLTATEGRKPAATDNVKCHYEGRLTDGTVFDSSYRRGEPATFPLNGVIAGWTEGLQLMGEGSKFRFFIPYHLAYGERGAGASIPPYAALIFDVELLEVV
ncbi:MAG: FKBP-type peptidyl-prolyl cis-trans isomerase [Bacteroidales bacterium]|nr:FKBP-type peptidyl-prolyl cis-trans isomerase [Bacteroidales bacterium]MDY2705694.1 FKBP-type peptidyl-prolyl cis-trans isomerase [Alloprevotella sp.]MCI6727829.1 FKBP-type peptidyl-prolyl cis-trans isomerase [Bacteroidales bacterium]MCI7614390.1 FKBP-type peptidyl-prolyl cis-trans isomerase [Bacteroidales bacterium]MDD6592841.1 FKBP-type peptidyl-prolyl cis-trans isomerase [Bacteroidales bacterium]